MFMKVKCPICSQTSRVLESTIGQTMKCPNCANLFRVGKGTTAAETTPPATLTQSAPAQATPPARSVPAKAEATLHYRCPRCNKPLESPANTAGQKVNCDDCGQRLQIPQAASPSPGVVNPTILGSSIPVPVSLVATPAQPPVSPAPLAEVAIVEFVANGPANNAKRGGPVRREHCLECGLDVTERQRVQTCPDCGSLMCSARCFRDHCAHAHPARR